MMQTKEATFPEFVVGLVKDEAKFREFSTTATSPEGLRRFAEANGYMLAPAEAERVFNDAVAFTKSPEAQQLDENSLEAVNGGISWAGIGAIAGGVVGTVGFGLAMAGALATGPLAPTMVAAVMGLSASGAFGLAASSATAGVVGAVAGALGGHAIDES